MGADDDSQTQAQPANHDAPLGFRLARNKPPSSSLVPSSFSFAVFDDFFISSSSPSPIQRLLLITAGEGFSVPAITRAPSDHQRILLSESWRVATAVGLCCEGFDQDDHLDSLPPSSPQLFPTNVGSAIIDDTRHRRDIDDIFAYI